MGSYAAAGSRIVNANTFGASAHKLAGSAYTLEAGHRRRH